MHILATRRPALRWLISIAVGAGLLASTAIPRDHLQAAEKATTDAATVDELAELFLAVSATVLEHHIDPPTRQQMLHDGMRAIYREQHKLVPAKLSRELSALADDDQIREFLRTHVDLFAAIDSDAAERMKREFLEGTLSSVSGGAQLLPPAEMRVQRQINENQYVGIGVAASKPGDDTPFTFFKVIRGGPAFAAGIREKDELLQVNGLDVTGMELRDIIDLLRGSRGSEVELMVRTPTSGEARRLTLTRDTVPFETAVGHQELDDGSWDFRLTDQAAYVGLKTIGGSTVHDLRQIAVRLQKEGFQAVMIDLRRVQGGSVHHATLLADALLHEASIGSVWTSQGQQRVESRPGEIFSGWPMVVLVDQSTSGAAEWIAAALQDKGRARLVGDQTAGAGYARELVEVQDTGFGLSLVTGIFMRSSEEQPLIVTPWNAQSLTEAQTRAMSALGNTLSPQAKSAGVTPDVLVTGGRRGGRTPAAVRAGLRKLEKR